MRTKPLSLDLIEQRRYLERIARAVREASRYLARYVEHFGQSAVGAKYSLAFKVHFQVRDRGKVDITTSRVVHTQPGEPGETTKAKVCMYGEGQYDLFVPAGGSDADPDQARLFADDGATHEGEI